MADNRKGARGSAMTPTLAAELDRLGVIVRPVTPPKQEHPPAWKPAYVGQEPPF